MKKIKNAFSLIEVVVATSIITISVFGVYKLISENTKIINNSGNLLQANSLFPNIKECINYINNDFSNNTGNIYFGESYTGCQLDNRSNFIDNIEYIIKANITSTGNTNYVIWKIDIESDQTKKLTQFYKQIR